MKNLTNLLCQYLISNLKMKKKTEGNKNNNLIQNNLPSSSSKNEINE